MLLIQLREQVIFFLSQTFASPSTVKMQLNKTAAIVTTRLALAVVRHRCYNQQVPVPLAKEMRSAEMSQIFEPGFRVNCQLTVLWAGKGSDFVFQP